MREIRVGLVGYGFGGKVFHAPLMRAVEGLRLAGVFSPSEGTRERAHAELRVATYARYEDLLASAVELVVISTPHDSHAELAIAALDARKHVVVDKIMCVTLEEADAMIAASARSGCLLSVYQNRRWDSDFLTLRRLLEQGALGDLLVIEARWVRESLSRRVGWRLFRERGGGLWLDLGAHMVDQLLLLGGAVTAVDCVSLFGDPELNVPTYTECRLLFDSGAVGIVETSAITPFPRPRWLVRGTDGSYEKHGLDPQEECLKRGQVGWPESDPAPPGRLAQVTPEGVLVSEVAPVPGDWSAFYRNVRDAINGEAPLVVRAEECRRALELLLAAERSAETGMVVRV
jgi:scyllo-inositol 2-dehydrogenase (NADP+)